MITGPGKVQLIKAINNDKMPMEKMSVFESSCMVNSVAFKGRGTNQQRHGYLLFELACV